VGERSRGLVAHRDPAIVVRGGFVGGKKKKRGGVAEKRKGEPNKEKEEST